MQLAFLILRLFIGLAFAGHGAQKAFGWWKGPGFGKTRGMMAKFGYRPAGLWALAVVGAELGGGLLLAIGLATPLASMLIISAMINAGITVHRRQGFFAQGHGIEVPLLYLVPALVVLIGGPGNYSLDHLMGISWRQPLTTVVVLVLAVIGAVAPLVTRPAAAAEQSGAAKAS